MSALREQVRRARTCGRRPVVPTQAGPAADQTNPADQAQPEPSALGHDLRLSLNAEIAACHVFVADARARRQPDRLAVLEAHESGLWDALGNAQQLP